MKCLVSFLLTVVSALNNVSAGEVTGLSTDLITRTSTVWSGGYLSSVSLQDAVLEPGVFQFAEIRSLRPMLGWRLENFPDNTIQTAYRVLVASSPELLEEGSADIWDSGRTVGDNSCAVRLDAELKPSSLYWWKVRVWDNHGGESAYSKAACFATASTNSTLFISFPPHS